MSVCTNCQMTKQFPGTNCSHCGRPIPELKPTTLTLSEDEVQTEKDHAEGQPDGVSEGTPETEEGQETEEAETEEVTLESGHVDNVGDDSETPVP